MRWTKTQADRGRDEALSGTEYESDDGRFLIRKTWEQRMTRVLGPGSARFTTDTVWELHDSGRLAESFDTLRDAKAWAEREASHA